MLYELFFEKDFENSFEFLATECSLQEIIESFSLENWNFQQLENIEDINNYLKKSLNDYEIIEKILMERLDDYILVFKENQDGSYYRIIKIKPV